MTKELKLGSIPTFHFVRKLRQQQDSRFQLFYHAGSSSIGLLWHIQSMVYKYSQQLVDAKRIWIKLASDGANSKNTKHFNVTYSLPNLSGMINSPRNCHQIGLFPITSENRETIENCLSKIIEEVKYINSGFPKIDNNGRTVPIEIIYGVDMK